MCIESAGDYDVHRDYPRQSGYGIGLATPHRVLGLLQIRPELRVIGYSEATWDAHHDVVACMSSSQPIAAEACPPVYESVRADIP